MMTQVIQYSLCLSLVGALGLTMTVPASANPVSTSNIVRGFGGFISVDHPSLPTNLGANLSTESGSSRSSSTSSSVASPEGAGSSSSATATSPNSSPSSSAASQFTPGATSSSASATGIASSSGPNITSATVDAPAVTSTAPPTSVNNLDAAPVVPTPVTPNISPALSTPPSTTVDTAVVSTPPAAVINTPAPALPAPVAVINSAPAPTGAPTQNQLGALVQVSSPEVDFIVVNSPAIASTVPPATTFIAPFAEAGTSPNLSDRSNERSPNTQVNRRNQSTSYRIVGMPSRVWPGLGLTLSSTSAE